MENSAVFAAVTENPEASPLSCDEICVYSIIACIQAIGLKSACAMVPYTLTDDMQYTLVFCMICGTPGFPSGTPFSVHTMEHFWRT